MSQSLKEEQRKEDSLEKVIKELKKQSKKRKNEPPVQTENKYKKMKRDGDNDYQEDD